MLFFFYTAARLLSRAGTSPVCPRGIRDENCVEPGGRIACSPPSSTTLQGCEYEHAGRCIVARDLGEMVMGYHSMPKPNGIASTPVFESCV